MTGRILWIVSLLVAFGGGFESGKVGHGSAISRILSSPRCASSKQFLVAFKKDKDTDWTLSTEGIAHWGFIAVSIAIDGAPIGYLGSDEQFPRTFVCEGVHEATIKASRKDPDIEEQYRIEFVVSRASLFRVQQYQNKSPETCISGRCDHDASLRLSSLDPDGPEVRAALKE